MNKTTRSTPSSKKPASTVSSSSKVSDTSTIRETTQKETRSSSTLTSWWNTLLKTKPAATNKKTPSFSSFEFPRIPPSTIVLTGVGAALVIHLILKSLKI
jgi:hypothetical protein